MKTSQTQKVYELLKDGKAHRTDEIMALCYGSDHLGLARIGARIFDIKREYGVEIEGWKDETTPSLFWYQMKVPIVSLPVKNCQVNLQPALFNMPESEREPSVIF
ncbi:MAG: hypothetical protein WC788_08215 [Candidatus Paceibacterota bacterium]|jgi:hypothetical protein